MSDPTLPLDDADQAGLPPELTQEPTRDGPITFEDVRKAFGDGFTNARTIRDHLGRGSMATIQKHLRTLRSEADAKATEEAAQPGVLIPPPPGVLEEIWNAALRGTQVAMQQRLLSLTEERDRLAARAETLEADLDELGAEVDRLDEAAAQAKDERKEAVSEAALLRERLQDMEAAMARQAEAHQFEMARLADEHDASLKEARTRVDTLTAALDRVGEREGELRATLHEQQRRNDELIKRLAELAER